MGEQRWEEPVLRPPESGLYQVWVNNWWPVDDQGRVSIWHYPDIARSSTSRGSAAVQCSHNKSIAHVLAGQTCPGYVDVVQLPQVFVKTRYDQ